MKDYKGTLSEINKSSYLDLQDGTFQIRFNQQIMLFASVELRAVGTDNSSGASSKNYC